MTTLNDLIEKTDIAEQVLRDDGTYSRFDSYTPHKIREDLANTDSVVVGQSDIHIHGGLDRMTALIHMIDAADKSGESFPYVVMRDESNKPVSIHVQSQMQPILAAIATRKNHVESAHNMVMQEYQKLASVRDDETQTLSIRLKKAEEALTFVKNYKTHLTTAMKAYDPNTLPTDLPTLKEVIVGRLEAEANKNMKRITNAVTQQGSDMPASCDDQEDALRELAQIKQLAQLNINALETAANVKAEYDKAVKKMADVTPLNTPIYSVPGNPTPLDSPYKPSSVANRFTLRIRNPAGVEGIIETSIKRTSGNATHKIEHIFLDTKFRFLLLTITPGTEASEFSVTSRNLCGPGKPFVIQVIE